MGGRGRGGREGEEREAAQGDGARRVAQLPAPGPPQRTGCRPGPHPPFPPVLDYSPPHRRRQSPSTVNRVQPLPCASPSQTRRLKSRPTGQPVPHASCGRTAGEAWPSPRSAARLASPAGPSPDTLSAALHLQTFRVQGACGCGSTAACR